MPKLSPSQQQALKELAQVLARDERSSRLKPKTPLPPPPVPAQAQAPTADQDKELAEMFDAMATQPGQGGGP